MTSPDVIAQLAATLAQPLPALAASPLIDVWHPDVRATARRLAVPDGSCRATARRIHDFVRDWIHYGMGRHGALTPASQVLAEGVGCAFAKTTLLVALWRAAGLPARPRFAALDARVQRRLRIAGGAWLDHSYAEIWLGERWFGGDSHVLDRPLACAARARLREEERRFGYGLHVEGSIDWDGQRPAFAQYVNAPEDGLTTGRDYGLHADALALFESGAPIQDDPRVLPAWLRSLQSTLGNALAARYRAARLPEMI